ncbi:hypothetical protein BH10PLA1_BH10PLA1_13520 [soil metagenome]
MLRALRSSVNQPAANNKTRLWIVECRLLKKRPARIDNRHSTIDNRNMFGRIDVHSHILPGVDDGCATVEQSVACARRLVAAGYTHSFCTPHAWPSFPDVTRDHVVQWVAALQREVDAAGIPLKLIPGAEHNFYAKFQKLNESQIISAALAGKYVLADLWASEIPDFFEPSVKWLQSMGLTVILAHPERMRAVQDDPMLADYFGELGLLLQGNLQCFNDSPRADTRIVAERYLLEGRYFLLGSDCHKPDTLEHRMAGIDQAIEIGGKEMVDRLMMGNPKRLLA